MRYTDTSLSMGENVRVAQQSGPSFGRMLRNRPMMRDERRRTEEWDGETERRARQRDSPSPLQRELSARCRHSDYKQKVFSPLTSSTGPSAGRRHRNAHYSQGVTATVCHQSVGLVALPRKTMPQQGHRSDSSWKRRGGRKQTGMMKYTHRRGKPFNFAVQPDRGVAGWTDREKKKNETTSIFKISVVRRKKKKRNKIKNKIYM